MRESNGRWHPAPGRRRWFVATAVALLAAARAAGAQPADAPVPAVSPQGSAGTSIVARSAPDNVTVRAVRLDAPLDIDGRLDESVYTTVPSITDFIQQEPHEGQPATEKTEAWILFDDDNLYICGAAAGTAIPSARSPTSCGATTATSSATRTSRS